MGDIQKLHEQYRNDPSVVILTIANDENFDKTRVWMEKQGYDFPVLMDRGYVKENRISSFPTTWFVNPAEKIAFEKVGWSEHLEEEANWRIKAMLR